MMPSRASSSSSSSSAGGSSGIIDLYAVGIIYVGVLTVVCAAFPKRIPIGILFDKDAAQSQAVVRYEIERFNNGTSFRLDKYEKLVEVEESVELAKAVCTTMSKGIFGLLAVADRPFESFVYRQTGSAFGMPYLTSGRSVNWTALGEDEKTSTTRLAIHVRPLYDGAMFAVIRHYRWSHVYYIYDSEDGLYRLQNLHNAINHATLRLSIEPIRVLKLDGFHSTLRRLDARTWSIRDKFIILDLGTMAALRTILRQIINVGMHRDGFHYLLACLAIDEVDLSGFRYGGANVTSFQLVDRSSDMARSVQREWSRVVNGSRFHLDYKLKVDAMLSIDAVSILVRGFSSVLAESPDVLRYTYRRGQIYNDVSRGAHCGIESPWQYGGAIYQHLRSVQFEGLTGLVSFDSHGYRTNFTLDVYQATFNSGPKKMGVWNSTDGELTVTLVDANNTVKLQNTNVTVIVTTILSPPYLMIKKSVKEPGNDMYEGYCADLARKLSESIKNFHYQLKVVADNSYGAEQPDKSWNGMIGELQRSEAHVAIAPLTITSQRERVVDFTKPFMNLGISIMIKKPEKQKPGVFSFMAPLSSQIWMCIVVSYFGVSLTLAVVGRFSPYERQPSDDDDDDDDVGADGATTDFTLSNSLWFALGAFMQQGCDISPRSTSGRLAGSAWWFFTLILVSTYTANLAAFLTVERIVTPINSAEDLAKQTVIQYGTLDSGSTKDFFKFSRIPTFETMWNFMNSTPGVFVKKTDDGVAKVRESKGKYAFLMESTMNEFFNNRKPCDTMKVGDNLDSKGYGIATPLGSELRQPIGFAVLYLIETGELSRLQKKWWLEKGECPPDDSKSSSTSALTLSNVAGIFYILVSGLGVALVVAFFEYLWKSRSRSNRHQLES